jgi:Cu-Zn family superoxide dismutase
MKQDKRLNYKKLALAILGVSALALTGCQHMPFTKQNPAAQARLMNTMNQAPMGTVSFTPVSSGVLISGTITGLAPNSIHAIHVHENGNCADMGKAAGGHFNPMSHQHGHPNMTNSHAGELPNIMANSQGVATINFINPKISVTNGAANSVMNRGLIVHAKADDYQSQPAGNAGDRIACAVIR